MTATSEFQTTAAAGQFCEDGRQKTCHSGAVASQRRTHSLRWLPRKRRTLAAVVNRRAVTEGGVVTWVANVKSVPSNKPIKPALAGMFQA